MGEKLRRPGPSPGGQVAVERAMTGRSLPRGNRGRSPSGRAGEVSEAEAGCLTAAGRATVGAARGLALGAVAACDGAPGAAGGGVGTLKTWLSGWATREAFINAPGARRGEGLSARCGRKSRRRRRGSPHSRRGAPSGRQPRAVPPASLAPLVRTRDPEVPGPTLLRVEENEMAVPIQDLPS